MGDWFSKQTLGSLPERAARRWGTREALYFKGRRWSFAELSARVDRLARGLIGLGVAPGDKVALWMVNRPEFIETMFAVLKIGAILVAVNTRLRTDDVAYILGQSDSSVLIIAERSGPVDYLGMVKELAPSLRHGQPNEARFPRLRRVISLGDAAGAETLPWTAVQEAGDTVDEALFGARAEAVDPDATAFFMYTSGTTGFPKGAMHDHAIVRNLIDRAFRMAITPADAIMMYLPLFHLFGFSDGVLMSMVTGARQVLTETFDPDESLALVEQERATVLHGFDIHFKELMEAHERFPRDVSSVRTGILASGMSSSVPIARKARKVLGRFLSGYGMSEFGVGAALSALDSTEEQCTEASGFPAPGYEIRVVDPQTGRDQPPGVPGEILVRSYMTMQGYYGKPEETALAIDGDGWVHSGDMGVIRADGHLRFMGRYKDMLKIGGENVDPMEVEAFLMSHAGIDLAAVVSFPDSRLSEVGVAFVKCHAGCSLTDVEVLSHCKGRIASFKIPRHVVFVDDFPMTSSGKIQKVKLREEAVRRITPA
ncbi:MAG: AMP-binding protein [Candidatus Rokuibacteriota bacterium]|nr:MAG: AMP-binding protein [Candidatus Rokubacteria bacterium]